MQSLPEEILFGIATHLTLKSGGSISETCRTWRRIVRDRCILYGRYIWYTMHRHHVNSPRSIFYDACDAGDTSMRDAIRNANPFWQRFFREDGDVHLIASPREREEVDIPAHVEFYRDACTIEPLPKKIKVDKLAQDMPSYYLDVHKHYQIGDISSESYYAKVKDIRSRCLQRENLRLDKDKIMRKAIRNGRIDVIAQAIGVIILDHRAGLFQYRCSMFDLAVTENCMYIVMRYTHGIYGMRDCDVIHTALHKGSIEAIEHLVEHGRHIHFDNGTPWFECLEEVYERQSAGFPGDTRLAKLLLRNRQLTQMH